MASSPKMHHYRFYLSKVEVVIKIKTKPHNGIKIKKNNETKLRNREENLRL
jgi:hypothetical protein